MHPPPSDLALRCLARPLPTPRYRTSPNLAGKLPPVSQKGVHFFFSYL